MNKELTEDATGAKISNFAKVLKITISKIQLKDNG